MSGFSGQGKVLVGQRMANGQPDLMRWIGNASKCVLQLTEDDAQRNESYSGQRLPFRTMTKTRKGSLSIVFDEFSPENMALANIASVTTIAAGTAVSGYTFSSGAKVGNYLTVPNKNISAVVVKDSSATPKVLVQDTHYRLSAFAGNAELLDITTGGPYVQPFKMDYTPGMFTKIGAFTQPTKELYLQFIGINTDDGTPIVADIFRVRLKPVKEVPFITDDYVDFDLEGMVMADMTRQSTSADGQFYTISST